MGCLWSAFKTILLLALAFVNGILLFVSILFYNYNAKIASDMKAFFQESTAEAELTVTEIMYPDKTAFGQYQDKDGVLHTDVPVVWHTALDGDVGETWLVQVDPAGERAALTSDLETFKTTAAIFLFGIVISSVVLLLVLLYTVWAVRRLIKQRKQEKRDEENMIKEIMERNQYD